MIDDPIKIAFVPPDPDIVWEHYLETCRRAGVTPVSREHADGLMQEWTATFAAGMSGSPTQQ